MDSHNFQSAEWPRLTTASGARGWLYTGGWENDPQALARLSRSLPLYGNGPSITRKLRNPRTLSNWLTQAGFASPWNFEANLPTSPGTWILKPRNSVGGLNVHRLSHDQTNAAKRWLAWRRQGGVIQREIVGTPLGVSFLATPYDAPSGNRGSTCTLLGACLSLTTRSALHAPGFAYCGSIGPLSLDHTIRNELERLGNELTESFKLRGLFGVDVIHDGTRLWTIEVNPRYSSSMELLEWCHNVSMMQLHLSSFDMKPMVGVSPCRATELAHSGANTSANVSQTRPSDGKRTEPAMAGKAIQYVPPGPRWIVGEAFVTRARQANQTDSWPKIADIPRSGTELRPGEPAFTVFESTDRLPLHSFSLHRSGAHRASPMHALEQALISSAGRWWQCLTDHSISTFEPLPEYT